MASHNIDFSALESCLQTLQHLFIDISRLKIEPEYEERRGGYGDVHVATLDSDTPTSRLVAAKTIRLKLRNKEPQRLALRLARELKVWAALQHPHVLPLLGYYLDQDYKIAILLSEYMIKGDLRDYMEQENPSWDLRLQIVRDSVDGLAYLHTRRPAIRHGDLKTGNVLINAQHRAMLADFGLSKALEEGPTGLTTSEGLRGTLRYYSPELLDESNTGPELPSDIWAWACLTLELLVNILPYANKKSEQAVILALLAGQAPCDTESLPIPVPEIKSILTACWAISPSERPSASHCLSVLNSLSMSSNTTKALDNDVTRLEAPLAAMQIRKSSPSIGLDEPHTRNVSSASGPSAHQAYPDTNDSSRPRVLSARADRTLYGPGVDRTTTVLHSIRRKDTRLWNSVLEDSLPASNSRPEPASQAVAIKWIRGELIGKGFGSTVYLALNATTGEIMALKEIAMHGGSALKLRKQENNPQATQAQNALLELDHPNIVQYLGFEVTDRLLRVFLEYVPGGSISSLLRRQGKFDEDVIKFFTAQIVDGLAYLHGRNITHKDLKADEILVDPSGQCKISDYGLSKLEVMCTNKSMTTSSESTFWMAPEAFGSVDGHHPGIDIWSLGCVFLEMFTGQRPWYPDDASSVSTKLKDMKLAPPVPADVHLSQSANDFRLKCFAQDPTERPSAEALKSDPWLIRSPEWEFSGFR